MRTCINIFISFILLCTIKVEAQKPLVSSGSIFYFTFQHSKFITPKEVAVWLPENYNQKLKYDVIYMQDGQALFDTAISWNHQTWEVDETIQQLISNNKIKNCIVVGIYNAASKRRSEYFPRQVFNSLSKQLQDSLKALKDKNDQAIFNGDFQSDAYLKFIVYELKPYIDSCYSTNSKQNGTFMAGSSMGALVSLYALCEYPQVFGGAACLSTHWTGTASFLIKKIPEEILLYFRNHLPVAGNHKIYFDYGSVGLDSLYKPYQNKMDEIMIQKHYTKEQWITREFIGEGHHESAWRKRLPIPFEFLLKKY